MRTPVLMLLLVTTGVAQESSQRANSFFEASEAKSYSLENILVEGEVENPGPVDLKALPLRSCAIKEVAPGKDKPEFKGAYFYQGYSLYDVLNGKKVSKAKENSFSPFTDLYVVVENARGDKALFSWGEIYYARDNFAFLISKTAQSVNPSKLSLQWALPAEPRLVCANDLLNVRYISNPIRLTVKSFLGTFATEKPKDIYSPEINFVAGTRSTVIRDIRGSLPQARSANVGYGHGTGFKGFQTVQGFYLKDVMTASVTIPQQDWARSVAVISAKDGYRSVFSVCELMNRNDNRDYLLRDNKDSREDGRYTVYAVADFFVDRNVKSVEKIEIVKVW